MATLNVTQHFTVTLADGTTLELGSKTTPFTLTLTNGTRFDALDVIPDDYGEDVLWQTGDGGLDTFEVALIYADVDVWMELRTASGGLDEQVLHKIQGGVWHMFSAGVAGGDSTYATRFDGSALVEDTDYDDITQIEFHNPNEADGGDATVHLILLG